MNDWAKLKQQEIEIFGGAISPIVRILLGVITSLIALLFIVLFLLLLVNFRFETLPAVGTFMCGLMGFSFCLISMRLLLNRKKEGGLFSRFALKVWCVFFGVVLILFTAGSLYHGQYLRALTNLPMLVVCYIGWVISSKRKV